MESSSDVQMSNCAGGSETTIEIKIKTLDSQTYNLRVNKCVPVPLLKEKIATLTGILSEQQRLICRGRVLKDDELLSAYHVEDGHTLHLVVRQPGQSATSGNSGTEANTSNSGSHRSPTVARSIVLEAVNVDRGSSELPAFAAQIIQSLLGPFSTQSSGAPAPSDTRPSEATQSSIPNNVRVELDQQQVPLLFQSEPAHGSSQPNVIPDALTTISQFIDYMRDSFRREGFNQNGQTEGNMEHRTAGSTSVGGTQNQESQPDSASTLGLPTAALLAETMHSTKQIVEQAGALLSQLSTQLGDLVNVTDSATRRNLQSSAMRSGVLLQNLGSLLLELGRTTMMLRINPASSEAVVNSGPALYISPSGPNPLMVQPVPFFPGRSVQMGPVFSSLNSQGSVLHPRDVEIHVHTSNLGSPIDVNVGSISDASPGQQNGLGPFSHLMDSLHNLFSGSLFSGENGRANGTSQQAPMTYAEQGDARNRGTPEVSVVSEEGLRFANMVQQIMPFISQIETQHQSAPPDSSSIPLQAASESSNRARDGPSDSRNSHQHNRDRIDEPNSKRQRTSD
ncbi:ubiquitin-like domain-containing protein CIP73 isoform X6 [Phragmites australis]|uniref:ubiquitin-like domain-containing protein CIP73 isoform X6 n=1 Tax=Phragmites australis TaxID=29695 RepID=UPI002D77B5D1|nr:ubiquitin-like domain-containing protein CIP73 isoform X6 [Phragmites australis]